ncbi:hypothetical protein H696_03579 [Fonticula alba]|uniref:Adenosinetriphosphatase n=1 Tax=Fonticula alba TaxID=691883 RepID=A0A058Z874_FONAL|nr:hypothetical protein H696_03579 [Fonticula alba]KCV70118.1 hypothetical protein H696_03579 [Fonticula alba]|eukprot:XP_009495724.1 hypothetical protein H696_03579 [Fonticula alba]
MSARILSLSSLLPSLRRTRLSLSGSRLATFATSPATRPPARPWPCTGSPRHFSSSPPAHGRHSRRTVAATAAAAAARSTSRPDGPKPASPRSPPKNTMDSDDEFIASLSPPKLVPQVTPPAPGPGGPGTSTSAQTSAPPPRRGRGGGGDRSSGAPASNTGGGGGGRGKSQRNRSGGNTANSLARSLGCAVPEPVVPTIKGEVSAPGKFAFVYLQRRPMYGPTPPAMAYDTLQSKTMLSAIDLAAANKYLSEVSFLSPRGVANTMSFQWPEFVSLGDAIKYNISQENFPLEITPHEKGGFHAHLILQHPGKKPFLRYRVLGGPFATQGQAVRAAALASNHLRDLCVAHPADTPDLAHLRASSILDPTLSLLRNWHHNPIAALATFLARQGHDLASCANVARSRDTFNATIRWPFTPPQTRQLSTSAAGPTDVAALQQACFQMMETLENTTGVSFAGLPVVEGYELDPASFPAAIYPAPAQPTPPYTLSHWLDQTAMKLFGSRVHVAQLDLAPEQMRFKKTNFSRVVKLTWPNGRFSAIGLYPSSSTYIVPMAAYEALLRSMNLSLEALTNPRKELPSSVLPQKKPTAEHVHALENAALITPDNLRVLQIPAPYFGDLVTLFPNTRLMTTIMEVSTQIEALLSRCDNKDFTFERSKFSSRLPPEHPALPRTEWSLKHSPDRKIICNMQVDFPEYYSFPLISRKPDRSETIEATFQTSDELFCVLRAAEQLLFRINTLFDSSNASPYVQKSYHLDLPVRSHIDGLLREFVPLLDTDQKPTDDILDNDTHSFHTYLMRLNNRSAESVRQDSAALLEMQKTRNISPMVLPLLERRQAIIDAVRNNAVTIISTDTGSGKSTQVPQYILDDMIRQGEGSEAVILVSQPKRMATLALANRIANERQDPQVGMSVGYSMRGDTVMPKLFGSIIMMTTGSLIKFLTSKSFLGSPARAGGAGEKSPITHLIIDEVHERRSDIDFILYLARLAVNRFPNLRVVLMSATVEADHFAGYYPKSTVLNFSTRFHEVESLFEEEIHHEMALAGFNPNPVHFPGHLARDLTDQTRGRGVALLSFLLGSRDPHFSKGDILVFLPGISDILAMERLLEADIFNVGVESKAVIIPLYSSIPIKLMEESINRPIPNGYRRIFLSTNIAETSLTFPAVVHVVDSFLEKIGVDGLNGNSSGLVAKRISKASSRQRLGRAGRVANGLYYAYSIKGSEYDQPGFLADYSLPDILFKDVRDLVLFFKTLPSRDALLAETKSMQANQMASGTGANGAVSPIRQYLDLPANQHLSKSQREVYEFFDSLPSTPPLENIHSALRSLQVMGALSSHFELTAFGNYIVQSPVSPGASRVSLLASLFDIPEPLIISSVLLDVQSPHSNQSEDLSTRLLPATATEPAQRVEYIPLSPEEMLIQSDILQTARRLVEAVALGVREDSVDEMLRLARDFNIEERNIRDFRRTHTTLLAFLLKNHFIGQHVYPLLPNTQRLTVYGGQKMRYLDTLLANSTPSPETMLPVSQSDTALHTAAQAAAGGGGKKKRGKGGSAAARLQQQQHLLSASASEMSFHTDLPQLSSSKNLDRLPLMRSLLYSFEPRNLLLPEVSKKKTSVTYSSNIIHKSTVGRVTCEPPPPGKRLPLYSFASCTSSINDPVSTGILATPRLHEMLNNAPSITFLNQVPPIALFLFGDITAFAIGPPGNAPHQRQIPIRETLSPDMFQTIDNPEYARSLAASFSLPLAKAVVSEAAAVRHAILEFNDWIRVEMPTEDAARLVVLRRLIQQYVHVLSSLKHHEKKIVIDSFQQISHLVHELSHSISMNR